MWKISFFLLLFLVVKIHTPIIDNSRICHIPNQIRCIFGLVYISFVSTNTILAKYIYKLDICIMYCFLFSNLNLLDMLLVMDFLGKIVHLLILKTISKPIFFFYRLLTYKVKKTFSWGFQIYLHSAFQHFWIHEQTKVDRWSNSVRAFYFVRLKCWLRWQP